MITKEFKQFGGSVSRLEAEEVGLIFTIPVHLTCLPISAGLSRPSLPSHVTLHVALFLITPKSSHLEVQGSTAFHKTSQHHQVES